MFFQRNGYYVYKLHGENTFIIEVNGDKIRCVYDDDQLGDTNISGDSLKVDYSEEYGFILRKSYSGQHILNDLESYSDNVEYFENKGDIVIEML